MSNHEQPEGGAEATPPPPEAPASPSTVDASSSPDNPSPKGMAVAALAVGVIAFFTGWLPIVGLVLGAAAVILGVVAVRKKQHRAMSVIGIVLGAIAAVTSIALTVVFAIGATISEPQADTSDSPEPVASAEAAAPPDDEVEEQQPEATPAPPSAPDLASFEETDDRDLALIAKNPDAHIGTNIVMYGEVVQYDSFTGVCGLRANTGATPQEYAFDYMHNTILTSGDGESTCPVLDPVVQGDVLKMWVTVEGSYEYDTTIGGTATAIFGEIWDAEILPQSE